MIPSETGSSAFREEWAYGINTRGDENRISLPYGCGQDEFLLGLRTLDDDFGRLPAALVNDQETAEADEV